MSPADRQIETVTFRAAPTLLEHLRQEAARRDIPVSEVIRDAIRRGFDGTAVGRGGGVADA